MLLYRSLILGLVGALVMIEAARSGHTPRPRVALSDGAPPTIAIVDVSRRALDAGADVGPVVGLHPGERIARLDDQPVTDGTSAIGAAIRGAEPGQYLDVDVTRSGGQRRILVLVH